MNDAHISLTLLPCYYGGIYIYLKLTTLGVALRY